MRVEFSDWLVAFVSSLFTMALCLPAGFWLAKKAIWAAIDGAVKTKWGEDNVVAFIRRKAAAAQAGRASKKSSQPAAAPAGEDAL